MITSQEIPVLLYQQTGGYVMRLRLLLVFLFSSLKSCNSVSFSFNVFIVGKAFQSTSKIHHRRNNKREKEKTNKSIDTESRRWENMDGGHYLETGIIMN